MRDKVICVTNGYRTGWDHQHKTKVEKYLANGEVGLIASVANKGYGTQWALALARREHEHFYFGGRRRRRHQRPGTGIRANGPQGTRV